MLQAAASIGRNWRRSRSRKFSNESSSSSPSDNRFSKNYNDNSLESVKTQPRFSSSRARLVSAACSRSLLWLRNKISRRPQKLKSSRLSCCCCRWRHSNGASPRSSCPNAHARFVSNSLHPLCSGSPRPELAEPRMNIYKLAERASTAARSPVVSAGQSSSELIIQFPGTARDFKNVLPRTICEPREIIRAANFFCACGLVVALVLGASTNQAD